MLLWPQGGGTDGVETGVPPIQMPRAEITIIPAWLEVGIVTDATAGPARGERVAIAAAGDPGALQGGGGWPPLCCLRGPGEAGVAIPGDLGVPIR